MQAWSRSGTSLQESVLTWTPPLQHDREMVTVMDIGQTRTGLKLGFIAGVTQIGLDDNLL
jgi:hypothetical protein